MGSEIIVNTDSEYYEDDTPIDPNECIKIDDGSTLKCIKVSSDAYDKCIDISVETPYIDVGTDDKDDGCSGITDLPEMSVIDTIENKFMMEMDARVPEQVPKDISTPECSHFYRSDIGRWLVTNGDVVTIAIDNYKDDVEYSCVWSTLDGDWIDYCDRDSAYVTDNKDGTLTLKIPNTRLLDGWQFEVYLQATDGDKCISDIAYCKFLSMVRSDTPIIDSDDKSDTCLEWLIIENYKEKCSYSFELMSDGDIIELNEYDYVLKDKKLKIYNYDLKEPLYLYSYATEIYKYTSYNGSYYIQNINKDEYPIDIEFGLIDDVETVIVFWTYGIVYEISYDNGVTWENLYFSDIYLRLYTSGTVKIRGYLNESVDSHYLWLLVQTDNIDYCIFYNCLYMTLKETFEGCSKLKTFKIVKNMCDIRNIESAFKGCSNLTELDLQFVQPLDSADDTFNGCSSLESVKLGSLDNVSSANNMFSSCYALINIPETFIESNLDNIESSSSMFSGCSSLTIVPDLKLKNSTNCNSIFNGCNNLISIGKLYLDNVLYLEKAFENCYSLKSVPYIYAPSCKYISEIFAFDKELVNIDSFEIPKASLAVSSFAYCSSLVNIENINIGCESESLACDGMFAYCTSIIEVNSTEFFENVTSSYKMFYGCTSLTYFEVLNFPKATEMSQMFSWDERLESVSFDKKPDVSSCANFLNMFEGCYRLKYVCDFSNSKDDSNYSNMFIYNGYLQLLYFAGINYTSNTSDFGSYLTGGDNVFPKLIRPSDGFERDENGNYVLDDDGNKIESSYGNEIEYIEDGNKWSMYD